MKVTVIVKPNSRKESIEPLPDKSLQVRVNAPPIEGKANTRIIELLSEYFKKPKSCFQLVSGHRGKKKIFEIS